MSSSNFVIMFDDDLIYIKTPFFNIVMNEVVAKYFEKVLEIDYKNGYPIMKELSKISRIDDIKFVIGQIIKTIPNNDQEFIQENISIEEVEDIIHIKKKYSINIFSTIVVFGGMFVLLFDFISSYPTPNLYEPLMVWLLYYLREYLIIK